MDELDRLFRHVPHPRTVARSEGRVAPPPTVDDQREGLNGKLGLMITTGVVTGVATTTAVAIRRCV